MTSLRTLRACFALLLAPSLAQAACPFNVTATGVGGDTVTNAANFDLLRDGLLLLRYAQGLRGSALVAGTGADAVTVGNNISGNLNQLDVNGDGLFDVQDAQLITRAAFGISSAKLADGIAAVNFATRPDAGAMRAFISGGCTVTFAAPGADQIEASRFLTQSTFGPSLATIQGFLALPPDGAVSGSDHRKRRSRWLSDQFALPRAQSHFSYLLARKAEYDALNQSFYSEMARESFWGQALKSEDQLRQRVAFALSEVMVVSENGISDPFGLAGYLDVLADASFGNFRDLLQRVALSPAMGEYLNHLRNDGNSATPNENFAREVLQLFSVGLVMLNVDGTAGGAATYGEDTVKGFARAFTGFSYDDPYCKAGDPGYAVTRNNCRDGNGATHPYWWWYPGAAPSANAGGEAFPPVLAAWNRPMAAFPGKHSALAKQLLKYDYANPVAACTAALAVARPLAAGGLDGLLPAINTTGSGVTSGTKVSVAQANADLASAIDNVFCHPNVGPFISRHLIKFLVTSNPTPGYVQRVASIFNDNGSGIRGDMKAVLRAIFLDAEAVSPATALSPADYAKFGKLREPMLRLSAILRAFNGTSPSARYRLYWINGVEYGISQGPLQSPSVFNFYHPDFTPPGPVSAAGAVAPEFEITTTTAIASTQNFFGSLVANTSSNNLTRQFGIGDFSGDCNETVFTDCVFSDLSDLYNLQTSSAAMFDYIDLVLLGGTLSPANKAALAAALDSAAAYPVFTLPANPTGSDLTTWQARKRNRVKAALWLAVHTPEFQIQR